MGAEYSIFKYATHLLQHHGSDGQKLGRNRNHVIGQGPNAQIAYRPHPNLIAVRETQKIADVGENQIVELHIK